jgi:hypothetical protein
MKATAQRIVDRFPHLRDSAQRRQMLVCNAVASARIEGIQPDESRLREILDTPAKAEQSATRPQ